MKYVWRIRERRGIGSLDFSTRGSGALEAFPNRAVELLGRVCKPTEFCFLFPTGSTGLDLIRPCIEQKLCGVSYHDKGVTVLQPGDWGDAEAVLRQLMAGNLNGAEAFAPAVPGYIPRPRFLSGAHWFKRHLGHLKCFCLFSFEMPRMELWSKRGVDKACDDLFRRLQAKGLRGVMA